MTAPGPGQVLFAFVRHWARRASAGGSEVAEQGRLVLVTEAVHALEARGVPATVNAVADEIGIDQSGASRLLRRATEAGYLARGAVGVDRRRRPVRVTAAGEAVLRHAHDWQETVFDLLTQGWSAQQCSGFHQAMTDLMDRSHAWGVLDPDAR